MQQFVCAIAHPQCFVAWPIRTRYARDRVEGEAKACGGSLAYDDDLVAVVVHLVWWPNEPTSLWQATVYAYEVGNETSVGRGEWERWIAAEELPNEKRFPFECAALDRVRGRLLVACRRRAPWRTASIGRRRAPRLWPLGSVRRTSRRASKPTSQDAAWPGSAPRPQAAPGPTLARAAAAALFVPSTVDLWESRYSYAAHCHVCRTCHRSHAPVPE